MIDHHDVVIVGGRAAGAATAMLLARAGLDVVVLERSRYGADTLSTHALMRAGVLQLHRWDLLDRVIASGAPAIKQAAFSYGDERIVVPVKPSHGIDALYAPRRTVLDPILVDAAVDAGAELRFGTTVTDVRRGCDGRVDGVEARDVCGRPIEIGARFVVGADGVRSAVAQRVGAAIERAGVGASAYVYGYWSDVATDGYEWVFRPGAMAGVIPTNGGQVCVFAGSTPDRIGGGGLSSLMAVVRDADAGLADRLAHGAAPAGVRSFAGRPGFVRRSWGPGWALVGDAGYWKDPISAHGLTDALRDAELLSQSVVSWVQGDEDEVEAMASYQVTRDRLSAELFATTDLIAGQRWTQDEIPGLLRRLSAAMTDEVDELAALCRFRLRSVSADGHETSFIRSCREARSAR